MEPLYIQEIASFLKRFVVKNDVAPFFTFDKDLLQANPILNDIIDKNVASGILTSAFHLSWAHQYLNQFAELLPQISNLSKSKQEILDLIDTRIEFETPSRQEMLRWLRNPKSWEIADQSLSGPEPKLKLESIIDKAIFKDQERTSIALKNIIALIVNNWKTINAKPPIREPACQYYDTPGCKAIRGLDVCDSSECIYISYMTPDEAFGELTKTEGLLEMDTLDSVQKRELSLKIVGLREFLMEEQPQLINT